MTEEGARRRLLELVEPRRRLPVSRPVGQDRARPLLQASDLVQSGRGGLVVIDCTSKQSRLTLMVVAMKQAGKGQENSSVAALFHLPLL